MGWDCISAHGVRSLHIQEGIINAEIIQRFQDMYILAPRQHLLQRRRCIFQQRNAKPHNASITSAGLCSVRVWVLNWPACILERSLIENIWCIMKQKIQQRRPRTVEQLESYISQKQDNVPLSKHQQMVSSLPRHSQTFMSNVLLFKSDSVWCVVFVLSL